MLYSTWIRYLYMFKLADTLLRIDFHPLQDIPEWTEGTATDNWISQLVETSYTCGIEVVSMNDTKILLRMDFELSRQDIEKYIKSLPITLKREFEMCLMYKDVVRYLVKFDGKKVEITCFEQGKKKVPFWKKFCNGIIVYKLFQEIQKKQTKAGEMNNNNLKTTIL